MGETKSHRGNNQHWSSETRTCPAEQPTPPTGDILYTAKGSSPRRVAAQRERRDDSCCGGLVGSASEVRDYHLATSQRSIPPPLRRAVLTPAAPPGTTLSECSLKNTRLTETKINRNSKWNPLHVTYCSSITYGPQQQIQLSPRNTNGNRNTVDENKIIHHSDDG